MRKRKVLENVIHDVDISASLTLRDDRIIAVTAEGIAETWQ